MLKDQNKHAEGSNVLNMIRYLLVLKQIFQKLLVRQTDTQT